MKKLIAIFIALLSWSSAQSQINTERIKEGIQNNLTISTGRQQPYGEARTASLKKLPGHIEKLKINSQDRSTMLSWANEARQILEKGNANVISEHNQFCDQISENSRPIEQQLSGYVGAFEEMNQKLLQSFEDALSQLENVSRLTVESYLQDRIVPSTAITNIDVKGMVDAIGEESAIAIFSGGCQAKDPEFMRNIQQQIGQESVFILGY